tara:strand:+ start:50 stop:205 length:156 start_codon:yes stop_codon:yes gene_type:complete
MQWKCGQCGSDNIEWIVNLDVGPAPWDYYTCLDCDYEDQKNYFKGKKLKEN